MTWVRHVYHSDGVRAEESGKRTILARSGGIASKSTCRPLTWWRIQDVFGWLAAKELPAHPVYAMRGGGRWQRNEIRVASLGGKRGDGFGREQWEQEYYGDVLRRLDSRSCMPAPAPATIPAD